MISNIQRLADGLLGNAEIKFPVKLLARTNGFTTGSMTPLRYVDARAQKKQKIAFIGGKRYCYVGVAELPVVQVSVWAGMSIENKKKVVEGMTSVLEELGIPREAVTVIIYEASKTNWATGGQLHSEKYADR